MNQGRGQLRSLCVWALFSAVVAVLATSVHAGGWALSTGGPGTILPPSRLGGASGYADERDADLYPATAYDSATGRYLVVWLTARNADSSSSGLDVYGVFLDRAGSRIGSEFRISDSNSVARNALPAVAAGNGEFVVIWTARGGSCQLYLQRVTDTSYRSDRVLVSGSGHHHSPSVVYNPARHRYVVAFAEGDDYLAPTFFGAETSDCGNNPSSASHIKALEFHLSGDTPFADSTVDISDGNTGAFRPRLAYSAGLNRYLVAWEDRRNAGGHPYRFDVYAQRLGSDMTIAESDMALATGADYTNQDTSATWTPRPAVAGGDSQLLVAWFARQAVDTAAVWSVNGRLVPGSGAAGSPFTIAEMAFVQSHAGRSPAGFLAAASASPSPEYIVGLTSHLESVWGYMSFALAQRVTSAGQLLKMDGSVRSSPGVGYSVDYENDDQIAVAMAVNPLSEPGKLDCLMVYSKHSKHASEQDFDVWGVRIQIAVAAPSVQSVYLPLVSKKR